MINRQGNQIHIHDELRAEIEHGRELLRQATARRRSLELKIAQYGSHANASLQIELDETRKEIHELQDQLVQLEGSAHETSGQQSSEGKENLSTSAVFTPEWSVLRSHVQYVDANIAFQFADASQDVQVLLGFTTLFLGAALSFSISIVTVQSALQLTTFGMAAGFSFLISIVFGVLTIRANSRVKKVKKQLLGSSETEENMSFDVNSQL